MKQKKLSPGQLLLLIFLVGIWTVFAFKVSNSAAILIPLLIVPYFFPTLAAAFFTRKKNWGLICLCNLFFGLTGIGWLICLLWSAIPDSEDVISGSPKLQAMRDNLRASSNSTIRLALRQAEMSGLPEDQERLNAMVAEYRADYGTLPYAIQENIDAQAAIREGEHLREVLQLKTQELNHLRKVLDSTERRYRQTKGDNLLPHIKELQEQIKKLESEVRGARKGGPNRLLAERGDAGVVEYEAGYSEQQAIQQQKQEPSGDEEWKKFTGDLALCLADLMEGEFLVIYSKRASFYVQFLCQGKFGMLAEAAANANIEPAEAKLSTEDYTAMAQLGWKMPKGTDLGPQGSPNFFVNVQSPVDFELLAELATRTLRQKYGLQHLGQLQFDRGWNSSPSGGP